MNLKFVLVKKNIFSLILIVCSSALFAQNADELLKKVEEKGMAYKAIESEITYVLENKQENTTEKISGLIKVKGNKFRLDIDQTITFCDGKFKWVYLEESNEVNITEVPNLDELEPEERFMNHPLSVYSIYKSDFRSNIFGQGDMNGQTYTLVDLTPKSLDKPYFKIRYWISDSNDIYAIKYFQKDGMRITLFFDDFKTNIKLKESEFVFKESNFKNVEVIDLR